MNRKQSRIERWCALIVLSLLASGCAGDTFQSHPLDREVTIDGEMIEWGGVLDYLEDTKLAIGLLNDDDYLYVGLSSPNSELERQILGRGLSIWFDSEAEEERTFGIRYPLGIREMGLEPNGGSGERRDGSGELGTSAPRQDSRGSLADLYEGVRPELEILAGKSLARRMYVSEATGIEVAFGTGGAGFVYEMKVPLRTSSDTPNAVDIEEVGEISIGFETPEVDMAALREGMRKRGADGGGYGRPGGGGGGPGGSPRGSGPGGRGPGGMRGGPKELSVWITVSLAGTSPESNPSTMHEESASR